MINMTKSMIIATTFITLLSGCTTITCEEFDTKRKIMDWHFFPELETEYTFSNSNSDEIVFTQTSFEKSESIERQCNMCACGQFLNVSYEDQGQEIKLTNLANYDTELFPDWIGGINYEINETKSFLTIEQDKLIEQISEPAGDVEIFSIMVVENTTLNGINYERLTELEIINSANNSISKIWIQETNGLIAFEQSNIIWTKK